jgi:pyruvate/2-oxoglutarate dehydrogenase complex dihydrolipoamide acyltransferase (E2) component
MALKNCLLTASIVLLGGCATSTPAPSHQATASSEISTPVLSGADDPRTTAVKRYAREMGYKIEMRHGVQFYCRITEPPGSRFPEKQCLTPDGVFEAQQIAEQNQAYFRQHQACQGAGC